MKRLFGILLWALFCLFGTQLSFGQNNREQVLALQRQAIELMVIPIRVSCCSGRH